MSNWEQHQLLVLSELKRLGDAQESTEKAIQDLRIDLTKLKTENVLRWSFLSGVVAALTSLVLRFLKL